MKKHREEAEFEDKTPLARQINAYKYKQRAKNHYFYTESFSEIPTGEGADSGSI